ncbi:putative membrane protein [Psychromicrobium silvestre]|uniref:Putative membrane protein n=1 Tax=Psychromicrobium silvestre TaxID=1645614 RepID=A0A7Y9LT40_9MICC|nr:DUF202 domain-containing protein [Psychromicrobium silvestre]NYE95125.1 putative membrane protein [Psychromicrobium silvestre]
MSFGESRVADAGLQAERTALAWKRTVLTLTAGSVATGRALLPLFGTGSYLIGTLGLLAGIALWLGADRRYRALHSALIKPTGPLLPGVGLVAVSCAVVCLCCGLGALVLILFRN